MHIAFVNGDGKRVMIVYIEEVIDIGHLSEEHASFINLMCDSLGWRWEPVKQPRANSRILSYKELKNATNGKV